MKYLIFITLLLVSWATKAQSADTLDNALLTAEFNFWQANNDSSRFFVLLQKAQIYRHSMLYKQALNEIDRAENYALKSEYQAQLKYEKMLNSFLSYDYIYCSIIVFDSNEQKEHLKEIELMTLYSLNETENWEKCKTEMIQYLTVSDTNKIKEIKALPISYSYKNPEKSKHLSTFLPGLGETYSGYPLKGITSFVLNVGFLAFAGYNVYYSYYVTGLVSGLFPMLKFYGGGKRLSANLAYSHNEEEASKIKRQYMEEIKTLFN